jgi:alkylation response protein AidB-like acyl-CoA dehydrogenase
MKRRETTALLDAVERIRPLLAEHSSLAERERQLPQAAYDAMVDAKLFAMLAPTAYGGLELHPIEAMRVWEAVARIESAAAWNLVMNGTVTGFIAWLPADGAKEMLAEGPTTVAGALFPPQPAIRVDGGWRVTGQVPYASGCTNAKWLALPAVEMDGGSPKIDPRTGKPAVFGVFFPRSEGKVVDTWHTVGMRGTGSADIAVEDLFVPDRRTMPVKPLDNPAPGFEGPLYRMVPWLSILGEATVSVGIAAAAVEALIEVAKTKTPAYVTTPLREQQFAQLVAAKAKARVEASRDTLRRAAEQAYEDVEGGALLSWDAKLRLQLAVCFAAEACAEAVRLVCDGAGASSIRIGQPFERHLRDVQVLTQHSSKSGPRYVTAGRLMFGLDNDWVWLSF